MPKNKTQTPVAGVLLAVTAVTAGSGLLPGQACALGNWQVFAYRLSPPEATSSSLSDSHAATGCTRAPCQVLRVHVGTLAAVSVPVSQVRKPGLQRRLPSR